MKQHEIFAYAYDFISQIMDNRIVFESIRKIILFGSVARNDFSEESDVDLFIDVPEEKRDEIQQQIRKEKNLFETRCKKTWFLRGVDAPIKVVVGDIESSEWKELHEEIRAYGKILYGQYVIFQKKGKQCVLITYELKKLEQKRKMGLIRALYGYSLTKKGKKYVQKGFLEKVGGTKISANAFLIEKGQLTQVKKILHSYKVPYRLKDMVGD